MQADMINHYDLLIDENNDPVHDPEPLKVYMDKWDGQAFIDNMNLNKNKTVLEIGVGTGRVAVKAVPLCNNYVGIDISPKTIIKAKENLSDYSNTRLICGDFLEYKFNESFDVIYSTLTFMHIEDKQSAIEKVAVLLNSGGRFVLSIDKNKKETIDTGTRKIKIFPDNPDEIKSYILKVGLSLKKQYETEFAYIFVAEKC